MRGDARVTSYKLNALTGGIVGASLLAGCAAAPATGPSEAEVTMASPNPAMLWYESSLNGRSHEEVPAARDHFFLTLEAPSAAPDPDDLSGPGQDAFPVRYERAVNERAVWLPGGDQGRAELFNAHGQLIYRIEEGAPAYEGIVPAGDYTMRLSRTAESDEQAAPMLAVETRDAGTGIERTLNWWPASGAVDRGDPPDEEGPWGSFVLNRQASDDVNAKINTAVSRLNLIVRQIMRPHLRRMLTAEPAIEISPGAQGPWTFAFVGKAPLHVPLDGTRVAGGWPESRSTSYAAEMRGESLILRSDMEGFEMTTTFTPAGGGLTRAVVLTSPRLPHPLEYKLVYVRR